MGSFICGGPANVKVLRSSGHSSVCAGNAPGVIYASLAAASCWSKDIGCSSSVPFTSSTDSKDVVVVEVDSVVEVFGALVVVVVHVCGSQSLVVEIVEFGSLVFKELRHTCCITS